MHFHPSAPLRKGILQAAQRGTALVFAVLLLLFAGCARNLPPSENQQSSEPSAVSSSETDHDALLALLSRQIGWYELGCYGIPFDWDSNRHQNWGFAGAFAEEMGVPFGREGGRQELIGAMFLAWLGGEQEPDRYFSDVSQGDPRDVSFQIKDAQIEQDTAELVISRSWQGIELCDARYRFCRIPMPESIRGTLAEQLALDGSIWRFDQVEWLADDTVYETVLIETPQQLFDFAQRVNARDPSAVKGSFRLACDIDMTGFVWEPVGAPLPGERDYPNLLGARVPGGFDGTFDGAGHRITGISVDSAQMHTGFFGLLGNHAVVRDLTVEGAVTGRYDQDQSGSVGGFVAMISQGAQIENCRFIGTVEGFCYVGGFVGRVERDLNSEVVPLGETAIRNCVSEADVTCTLNSGGFVGYLRGKLEHCAAKGTLTILPGKVLPMSIGGFAGWVQEDLSGCHSAVKVTYEVPGANRMGNFCGDLGEYDITDCTIDPAVVRDDWYLVGFQVYRNSVIDIQEAKQEF